MNTNLKETPYAANFLFDQGRKKIIREWGQVSRGNIHQGSSTFSLPLSLSAKPYLTAQGILELRVENGPRELPAGAWFMCQLVVSGRIRWSTPNHEGAL